MSRRRARSRPHEKFGSIDTRHLAEARRTTEAARELTHAAERNLRGGDCKVAGGQIDSAYYMVGVSAAHIASIEVAPASTVANESRAVHKALRAVDRVFERQCVRRHPGGE